MGTVVQILPKAPSSPARQTHMTELLHQGVLTGFLCLSKIGPVYTVEKCRDLQLPHHSCHGSLHSLSRRWNSSLGRNEPHWVLKSREALG